MLLPRRLHQSQRRKQTLMFTTSPGAAAPPFTFWPASFRGVGFAIVTLPDGTYQAIAEGGYRSHPYVSADEALTDVTAWCALHAQGGW